MLHHNGHFLGVTIRQPIRQFGIWMCGAKRNEEVVRAGETVGLNVGENAFNQAAHRVVHQIAVVDGVAHDGSP